RLQLLGRGDRAGVEEGGQLLLDRLAYPRQPRDRPGPRHLLHRRRGLPDRLRGVPVGEHPVDDRAVELVEVGELVEVKSNLGVAHRSLGYGPPRCPPPGSYSPPTTRPRTSRRSCAPRCPSSRRRRRTTTSWSSTTDRPTGPARSPTGSRPSSSRSRCCIVRRRRAWA